MHDPSKQCFSPGDVALRELSLARDCGDENRCARAERDVVLYFSGAARSVAARFRGRGQEREDLEQVAMVGLIKATRRWSPPQGGFLQYAVPTVSGELKRHFRDHGSTIRIPRSLYEREPEVSRARSCLEQVLAREPHAAEIAAAVGIPAEKVRQIRAAWSACHPQSLDVEGPEGAGCEGAPYRSVPCAVSQVEFDRVELRSALRAGLSMLSTSERHITALYFVWGMSQAQVAASIGVSQMQVSRVLRTVLEKLRERVRQ